MLRLDKTLNLLFIDDDYQYPLDPLDVVKTLEKGESGYYVKGYFITRRGERTIAVNYVDLNRVFTIELTEIEVKRVRNMVKEVLRMSITELENYINQLGKYLITNKTLVFDNSVVEIVEQPKLYSVTEEKTPEYYLQFIVDVIFSERNTMKFLKATEMLDKALARIGNGFTAYVSPESPGYYLVRILPRKINYDTLGLFLDRIDAGEVELDKTTALTLVKFYLETGVSYRPFDNMYMYGRYTGEYNKLDTVVGLLRKYNISKIQGYVRVYILTEKQLKDRDRFFGRKF